MAGDGRKHRLDVFGKHHRPSRDHGPCARGREQHESRARRQPVPPADIAADDGDMAARRGKQCLNVVEQRRGDVDLRRFALPVGQRRRVGGGRHLGDADAAVTAHQQLALGGRVRIPQLDRHQETVELRFRQRVRADLLDRVLGRDDEKRVRQLACLAILRHLPLFHGLEQSALRLGRGTVDFVGQHDRAEDGTGMEAEGLRAFVEDRHAQHIGRQQVARELDPRIFESQRRRQRLSQRGLAHARDVLDQQVAARQHARQRQFEWFVLAHDDAGERLQDGRKAPGGGRTGLGSGSDGHGGFFVPCRGEGRSASLAL